MLKKKHFVYWTCASLALAAVIGGVLALTSSVSYESTPRDSPPQGSQEVASKPLRILFAGDIFFDRAIRRGMERRGTEYFWEPIKPLLNSYEFKVGNLEGPIWETASTTLDTMTFAFQPELVRPLKDLGFTALSLANNHALNQGRAGLENTRRTLEAWKVISFGDPNNLAEASYWAGELGSRRIALVGEHDLIANGQQDIEKVIGRLKGEGYFVIVYPHWGAEYVTTIPADERMRAHRLIDSGADLIIGAHPHVVQPIEVYRDRVIFYSLGNLLFDQYFSADTMRGLMVGMELTSSSMKFTLYPTMQDTTYRIHEADAKVREVALTHISKNSIAPAAILSALAGGIFELPLR